MNSIHDGQIIQPDGDEGACDHDGCEERATRIRLPEETQWCDEHAKGRSTDPLYQLNDDRIARALVLVEGLRREHGTDCEAVRGDIGCSNDGSDWCRPCGDAGLDAELRSADDDARHRKHGKCDCGADEHNARVDALAAVLRGDAGTAEKP
mgnify:CR=1 FL=1